MSESETPKRDRRATSQHTLPRREWLTTFAAGGILTAGATLAYESCDKPPRDPDAPELELEYIRAAVESLRDVDYVVEGKRRGLLSEDIQDALASDINGYLSTTYRAFVYAELVNALPEDLRESSEVQSDIAAMSPVLDQAVADAYYIIGMADEETNKQIDQELRDNPDALMDMASGLDDDGSRRGLGIRGRLRLRRASRQLSARLKMQSAEELFADITDQMTRYAERNEAREGDSEFGVSPAATRIVASYQEQEPVRGLRRWHPGAFEDPVGAQPKSPDSSRSAEAESAQIQYVGIESSERLRRLKQKEQGLKRGAVGLAGAGAALMVAGGIGYAVSGGVGGLVPVCIGGFLLLLSIFVAGALGRRRRQIREEEERLLKPIREQ